MRARIYIQVIAALIALIGTAWIASSVLERMVTPPPVETAAATTAPAAPPTVPHIIATLFYANSDGESLAAVQREVPLAEGVRAQGREILNTQLAGAPTPYISVTPAGTRLRAFYITDRGDAFVDLTSEVSTAHSGGSTNELMTVQAIVNAVTTNLTSVQRVQILVDGQEVDTLAGHVDLRRPFEKEQLAAGSGQPAAGRGQPAARGGQPPARGARQQGPGARQQGPARGGRR